MIDMLCGTCRSAFSQEHWVGVTYTHHTTYESLHSSRANGCHLCNILWDAYHRKLRLNGLVGKWDDARVLEIDHRIIFRGVKDYETGSLEFSYQERLNKHSEELSFELRLYEDCRLAPERFTQPRQHP